MIGINLTIPEPKYYILILLRKDNVQFYKLKLIERSSDFFRSSVNELSHFYKPSPSNFESGMEVEFVAHSGKCSYNELENIFCNEKL